MTEISYVAHCLRRKHNHVFEVVSASFFPHFIQPPICGFYLEMMTGPKFLSVHKNFSFMCPESALLIHAIRGLYEFFHWVYGIFLSAFVNEEERDCE